MSLQLPSRNGYKQQYKKHVYPSDCMAALDSLFQEDNRPQRTGPSDLLLARQNAIRDCLGADYLDGTGKASWLPPIVKKNKTLSGDEMVAGHNETGSDSRDFVRLFVKLPENKRILIVIYKL